VGAIVQTFMKHAVERRRLYLDYSNWLEATENLNGFQTVVTPNTETAPLALNLAYTDVTNKKIMVYISGGVANQLYQVQFIVQTDEGQKRRDDLMVKVS
jgi:hypothetical protein